MLLQENVWPSTTVHPLFWEYCLLYYIRVYSTLNEKIHGGHFPEPHQLLIKKLIQVTTARKLFQEIHLYCPSSRKLHLCLWEWSPHPRSLVGSRRPPQGKWQVSLWTEPETAQEKARWLCQTYTPRGCYGTAMAGKIPRWTMHHVYLPACTNYSCRLLYL